MRYYHPLVTVRETVDASPSEVWNTVIQRTGVMFMGAEVKTDWHEGHPITFEGQWKGRTYEDKGTIETYEKEKKLAFTHFSPMAGKGDSPENYNLVSIELQPKGSMTDVILTQSAHRQAEEPHAAAVAEFEKNWKMILAKLKGETEHSAGKGR